MLKSVQRFSDGKSAREKQKKYNLFKRFLDEEATFTDTLLNHTIWGNEGPLELNKAPIVAKNNVKIIICESKRFAEAMDLLVPLYVSENVSPFQKQQRINSFVYHCLNEIMSELDMSTLICITTEIESTKDFILNYLVNNSNNNSTDSTINKVLLSLIGLSQDKMDALDELKITISNTITHIAVALKDSRSFKDGLCKENNGQLLHKTLSQREKISIATECWARFDTESRNENAKNAPAKRSIDVHSDKGTDGTRTEIMSDERDTDDDEDMTNSNEKRNKSPKKKKKHKSRNVHKKSEQDDDESDFENYDYNNMNMDEMRKLLCKMYKLIH